jgi:hypothetical protein
MTTLLHPPPRRSEKLKRMSVDGLVQLFEQLSVAEGEASANFETAKFKRLYWRRRDVVFEMRHREIDERPALFVLYAHRHPQVRFNVAESTYALNPERAKLVLREIADSRMFPWAGDAGMSLSGLADGTSQLPNDPE